MRPHRDRSRARARAALVGALATAAVAGGAAACGEQGVLIEEYTLALGEQAQKAPTWVPTPEEPITLTLEVPPSVRRGENVPIRVVIHNGSRSPLAIGFGQRAGFNILVAHATGRADSSAVWSVPRYMFPSRDATVTDALAPGRDTVITTTWPGVDDASQLVPPGSYRVRATVSAELVSTRQLWSEWAPITVRP